MTNKDEAFMDSLFAEVSDRHDEIQIEHFIIKQNSHDSVWGTLRQCRLELHARRDALRQIKTEFKTVLLDIEDTKSFWRIPDFLLTRSKRARRKMREEELHHRAEFIRTRQLNTQHELDQILALARHARALAGDLTDRAHVRTLQVRFWANRIQSQLNACDPSNRIPATLMDVVNNLPKDVLHAMGPSTQKELDQSCHHQS